VKFTSLNPYKTGREIVVKGGSNSYRTQAWKASLGELAR
jgi:hypothetical protein